MQDTHRRSERVPWNKGRLIGSKPPLLARHVWSIRTRLQFTGKSRDLALFNLAIDSKLRGCDLMALKVRDVAPADYATDRAVVRQRKTGKPVKFELTDQTRQSIDHYLQTGSIDATDSCFRAEDVQAKAFPRGNMRVCYRSGS